MEKANIHIFGWVAILVLAVTSVVASGQEAVSPDPNPTQRLIIPRNDQSQEKQLSDERECFSQVCAQTDWDPYAAYAELVEMGYAVALTQEEMEEGLICLAREGAEIGAVAGDLVGDPERGAEIGAAIAIASEVIHSNFLYQQDDPEARRAVAGFERNLHRWEIKFAACLRSKGYRVQKMQSAP